MVANQTEVKAKRLDLTCKIFLTFFAQNLPYDSEEATD